jgi:hypothetical protein
LFVKLGEVGLEIEVMVDKRSGIIGIGAGGEDGTVVKMRCILPEGEYAAMEGAGPFVFGRSAPSVNGELCAATRAMFRRTT